MSDGIFYLDEERGRDAASRSPSPRHSPSPTTDSREIRSAPHHVGPHTSSSSSLQIPQSLPTLISPTPQPFTPSMARKHAPPFAATPSFPSPLAQAITVPIHSDTSSSGSHSDDETDNDALKLPESPTTRGESGGNTPRKGSDLVLRPRTTSPQGSLNTASSNTPGPQTASSAVMQQNTTLTPGSVLMRTQRSSATAALATTSLPGPINTNRRRSSPRSSQRISPQQGGSARRSESIPQDTVSSPTSPIEGTSRRRSSTASGSSSPSVPGSASSSLSPLPSTSPGGESSLSSRRSDAADRRRSMGSNQSSSRTSKDGNVLGLGWGTGWETGSSGSSSVSKDKGKAKDISGPPSPKIARADPMSGLGRCVHYPDVRFSADTRQTFAVLHDSDGPANFSIRQVRGAKCLVFLVAHQATATSPLCRPRHR